MADLSSHKPRQSPPSAGEGGLEFLDQFGPSPGRQPPPSAGEEALEFLGEFGPSASAVRPSLAPPGATTTVLRWRTHEVGPSGGVQDHGVEQLVQGWLNSNLDREVVSLNMRYSYDWQEGDKEHMTPSYLLVIESKPRTRHYRPGERVYSIIRRCCDGVTQADEENRYIQEGLDEFVARTKPGTISTVTVQNDFAPVMAGGAFGRRTIVGVLWEKGRYGAGKMHVLRHVKPDGQGFYDEDRNFEVTIGDFQASHPKERVRCYSSIWAWTSDGENKTPLSRTITVLYTEPASGTVVNPHAQGRLSGAKEPIIESGIDRVRFLADWNSTGDADDEGVATELNNWLLENPGKVVMGAGVSYDWGMVYGEGRNTARYVMTIHWEKATPENLRRYRHRAAYNLKAHCLRKIGADVSPDWQPEQEDRAFEGVMDDFVNKHPDRQVEMLKTVYGTGPFLSGGKVTTRYIAVALTSSVKTAGDENVGDVFDFSSVTSSQPKEKKDPFEFPLHVPEQTAPRAPAADEFDFSSFSGAAPAAASAPLPPRVGLVPEAQEPEKDDKST